jgi:hypothetical protein
VQSATALTTITQRRHRLQVWNYANAVFDLAATRGARAILPTFG